LVSSGMNRKNRGVRLILIPCPKHCGFLHLFPL
jgi:hypothetical protein